MVTSSTLAHQHPSIQILQRRRGFCFPVSDSSLRLLHLLQELEGLTLFQKTAIITRFISLVETFRIRTLIQAILFHIGRFIVTVGSLVVPALLSIQQTGVSPISENQSNYTLWWITWTLSLLVTTCNGILTLFKIDKKQYFIHTTLEQLKSETWQYIHLTGKYGGFQTKGIQPTFANQQVFQCHNMEKIKLKQIEEEYQKLIESQTHHAHPHEKQYVNDSSSMETKMIAGLYTPTPSQGELMSHKQELANVLVRGESKQFHTIDGHQGQTDTESASINEKKGRGTARFANPLSM